MKILGWDVDGFHIERDDGTKICLNGAYVSDVNIDYESDNVTASDYDIEYYNLNDGWLEEFKGEK